MKRKFYGDIKQIDPKLLINPNQHNKVESFFVRLGVVFNDIQSLILFENMLENEYEEPTPEDTSSHAGHYAGLKVYIHKSLVSTIHEFFVFLHKNKEVLDKEEFLNILSEIPKTDQNVWKKLVLASSDKFKNVSKMLDSIDHTRNTIGFHFDWYGSKIWKAFTSRFFREDKTEKNDAAYYSITNNFLTTRFYFSDASVEELLYLNAGKKEYEILKNDEFWKKYQNQTQDTVFAIKDTLSPLLRTYLSKRRNSPK